MKGLAIGRVTAAAILVSAAIATAAAPSAATEADCTSRSVSVSDAARAEGGQVGGNRLGFVVSTSGCAAGSVRYRTILGGPSSSKATENIDYVGQSGLLSWTFGDSTNRTIEIALVGELLVEDSESFLVELYDPVELTISDPIGVGTIINDDELNVTVKPDRENETEVFCSDAFTCEVRIVTSARAAMAVTVHFATRDDTATGGDDYVAVTRGTLTIPAGATEATARIVIRRERIMDRPEHFYVTIFEPSVGTVTKGEVRMRIPLP